MKDWYKNSYRRHLCDMHIDEWDETFLSEFSPEEYYNNLKLAGIQSAMIYFQSHVGLCYYPTKVGKMHNAFIGREDAIKKLIELCKAGGIDVIGYYSPNFNVVEHDKHPDWRMLEFDGKSLREKGLRRNGYCCPNNPDYHNFLAEQIKEFSEYFDFDGMFFDFPIWPQYCYCEHCKKRFEREVGGEIPTENNHPKWEAFEERRRVWIGEHAKFLYDTVKSYKPDITVEQNYAFAALDENSMALCEYVNKSCDYVGGDIYVDFLTQSFANKFYYSVTNNQPFEYMTGRCDPGLEMHTLTKSRDKLTLAIMLTVAHHGANLIIDAIDPVGTLDSRFYKLLGEINGKAATYEPYLKGELLQNIVVYAPLKAKINYQGQKFDNYTGSMNTVKNMIERHIPVGVISTENADQLCNYPFIILSNPNNLEGDVVDKFISYVENGGTLYFSNCDEIRLFETLVGGRYDGHTKHTKTYIAPKTEYTYIFGDFNEKYPIPFDCSLPIVSGIEEKDIVAKVVLPYTDQELTPFTKFASFHSNPPGIATDIPAVVIRKYGKGTVIWSAAPFENEKVFYYKDVINNLVQKYAGEFIEVCSTAPVSTEIITFKNRQDNEILVSVVDLNDGDKAILQSPFEIKIKADTKPKSVELLPNKEKIEFDYTKGEILFTTKELNVFDMYKINL